MGPGRRSFGAMARNSGWRTVPSTEWRGRLSKARAYLEAARSGVAMAEETSIGDPIISSAILATIAFGDALTIRFASIQNDRNHAGLSRTLARALGKRAAEQLRRVDRILGEKDDTQYGHRVHSLAEARAILTQVERFAEWAEVELAQP